MKSPSESATEYIKSTYSCNRANHDQSAETCGSLAWHHGCLRGFWQPRLLIPTGLKRVGLEISELVRSSRLYELGDVI